MTSQDWTNLAVIDLENAVHEARVGHLAEAQQMLRIGGKRLAVAEHERALECARALVKERKQLLQGKATA